jgi:hypothetical protein
MDNRSAKVPRGELRAFEDGMILLNLKMCRRAKPVEANTRDVRAVRVAVHLMLAIVASAYSIQFNVLV